MKKSFLFLASCLFILSCKKDDPITSQITAGQTYNMNIVVVNTPLNACNSCTNSYYYFDINNDGITDFRLLNDYYVHFISGHSFSNIGSKNNQAYFLTERHEETRYLKTDTSYSDTTLQSGQDKIRYIKNYSSCNPISNEDTILEVWDFDPVPLNEGDLIYANHNGWSNGATSLINDPDFYIGGPVSVSHPDTAEAQLYYYDHNCTAFPEDQIKYIPLKIGANATDKLGWVKIKISGDELFIYEYALQN